MIHFFLKYRGRFGFKSPFANNRKVSIVFPSSNCFSTFTSTSSFSTSSTNHLNDRIQNEDEDLLPVENRDELLDELSWKHWEWTSKKKKFYHMFDTNKDKFDQPESFLLDPLYYKKLSNNQVNQALSILKPLLLENRLAKLEKILNNRSEKIRFLFDNPSNPFNVWACIRTMDSFGLQFVDIVLNNGEDSVSVSDGEDNKLYQVDKNLNYHANYKLNKDQTKQNQLIKPNKANFSTSLSSQKWMTIENYSSINESIEFLHHQGYFIIASDLMTYYQQKEFEEELIKNNYQNDQNVEGLRKKNQHLFQNHSLFDLNLLENCIAALKRDENRKIYFYINSKNIEGDEFIQELLIRSKTQKNSTESSHSRSFLLNYQDITQIGLEKFLKSSLSPKLTIILGNEFHGIRNETRKRCDCLVSIPMLGFSESFNLSISCSIFLTELILKKKENKELFYNFDDEDTKNRVLLSWLINSIKRSKIILKQFNILI